MAEQMMGMNDQEEISTMLASLKVVAAPDDFEGGVCSRIAERRFDLDVDLDHRLSHPLAGGRRGRSASGV